MRRFRSRRTYTAVSARKAQRRRQVIRRRRGAKDCAPQSGLCPKLTCKGGRKYSVSNRGTKWMLVAIADGKVTTARCFHKWNKKRAKQMSTLIRDDLKRLYPNKPIGDWWIVRDGDPSQQSYLNLEIEQKLGMRVFNLPARSPSQRPPPQAEGKSGMRALFLES